MDTGYNNQITSMSAREPCLNCQHPRAPHQSANGRLVCLLSYRSAPIIHNYLFIHRLNMAFSNLQRLAQVSKGYDN